MIRQIGPIRPTGLIASFPLGLHRRQVPVHRPAHVLGHGGVRFLGQGFQVLDLRIGQMKLGSFHGGYSIPIA